jgi:hypothetical protein
VLVGHVRSYYWLSDLENANALNMPREISRRISERMTLINSYHPEEHKRTVEAIVKFSTFGQTFFIFAKTWQPRVFFIAWVLHILNYAPGTDAGGWKMEDSDLLFSDNEPGDSVLQD